MAPERRANDARTPVRVMVIDASASARERLCAVLTHELKVDIVAAVPTGRRALDALAHAQVDLVLLDLDLPGDEGMAALGAILAAADGVRVIVAARLAPSSAAAALAALAAGAHDYIIKPGTEDAHQGAFAHDLADKVRALVGHETAAVFARAASTPVRHARPMRPRALAIASSTGGPQALLDVLGGLGPMDAPVFITQHMPPTFIRMLAAHLAKATGHDCVAAREGDIVRAGKVYLAPGERHLTVAVVDGVRRIRLDDGPPVGFCRPAADPMMTSLVRAFDGRVLGIVLTGMGSDGLEGARAIVAAGGVVIAQDEGSSVVWGMPGAVATAGLCSAILPIDAIASYIQRAFSGVAA